MKIFLNMVLVFSLVLVPSLGHAHCGVCGVEGKSAGAHDHHDHDHDHSHDKGSMKGSMKGSAKAAAKKVLPTMAIVSEPEVYNIDHSHSQIGFAVKHLLISTTRGQFNDYEATISYDPADLSAFSADVVIQAASIDTNNEGRDNHLKQSDFFDVENHPTITFKSSTLLKLSEGLAVVGDLTIKGVTKKITIPVEISGPVDNPFGGKAIGITGEATINRQDFGVSWNKSMDNGGFVVDNTVRFVIEIEAHAK